MNRLKILNLTQEILVGPAFNLLKGTCKSITELEYHLEECSKATTERLDWHNPEKKQYPFDLRKPLSLIQDHRGRKIIPRDYFINKDLEYLKGGDLSIRYSTSMTKTKAATYDLIWIEDLVPNLWSPMQVKYDQHAYLGTSHWGPKRQRFYRYASNMTSFKDVYSRRRIITVTRLRIMKMYDYGHLEEIEVRRDDQKLYAFIEGDFKRLYLQDIEDMLLLLTDCHSKAGGRSLIRCRKLPKEAQPYQARHIQVKSKKRTAYTAYSDPKGVIYKDQMNKNRLMRTDELHKFSDGMLDDVRSTFNDIAKGIRMEYLAMRKWSNLDKKRARVMVQDIDKQLYQRRLMRNLEKFVGGRDYVNDLSLGMKKKSKCENKGKVPTEMELVPEQTQQGTSYEVSVSAEGVEELKRKVKIKGEKKEALLTLRAETGFNTTAGNHVKEILPKLNLPDHRSILTDSKIHIKMTWMYLRRSVKVKESQERRMNIKAFKSKTQEKYEHVGPKSQDHKMARLQDDEKRLCLVDDLKKFKITFYQVKDHYNIS
ncbi:hypothetical protein Tco_1222497 [Tanacetum coccineum]